MPYDTPTSDSIGALVADARARAREAACLIRCLDPWRYDPRVASIADLCDGLEGPSLFNVDTIAGIEALAHDLCERLAAAEASDARPRGAADLRRLHTALIKTVEAARKLEEIA